MMELNWIEQAILRYCAATGKQSPVSMMDFVEWLKDAEPETNEAFERHAAAVFNRAFEDCAG